MPPRGRWAAVLALTACSVPGGNGDAGARFSVSNLVREIDASAGWVVRTDLTADVSGSGSEFELWFNESQGGHLYAFEAETRQGRIAVLRAERASGRLRIVLNTSTSPRGGFELRALALHSGGAVVPTPLRVRQAERLAAELRFSTHVLSPYPVVRQSTRVRLASCLDRDTPARASTHTGCDIREYGPFGPATEPRDLSLRFEQRVPAPPWIHVKSATRELSVSHWAGTVAVTEHYDVENAGAALEGGFSRADYELLGARGNSFEALPDVQLPATAWGVSFSDALGNVSSSNLRRVGSDGSTSLPQQLLQLRPRYPVFGGWRVAFDVGYSIPLLLPLSPPVGTSPAGTVTGAALADGTFEIVVEAPGLALPQLPIDSLTLKVILPEGAQVVAASLMPQPGPTTEVQHICGGFLNAGRLSAADLAAVDSSEAGGSPAPGVGIDGASIRISARRRWGLLDGPLLGGRPVVVIEAPYVMSAAANSTAPTLLVVRYSLPRFWAVYKPMYLSALLFSAFIAVAMLSRILGTGLDERSTSRTGAGAGNVKLD